MATAEESHVGSKAKRTDDRIDHPAHYGGADNIFEHVKVVEALGWNYHIGNATKYIWRAGKKGDDSAHIDDLKKAVWYLQREIKRLGGG